MHRSWYFLAVGAPRNRQAASNQPPCKPRRNSTRLDRHATATLHALLNLHVGHHPTTAIPPRGRRATDAVIMSNLIVAHIIDVFFDASDASGGGEGRVLRRTTPTCGEEGGREDASNGTPSPHASSSLLPSPVSPLSLTRRRSATAPLIAVSESAPDWLRRLDPTRRSRRDDRGDDDSPPTSSPAAAATAAAAAAAATSSSSAAPAPSVAKAGASGADGAANAPCQPPSQQDSQQQDSQQQDSQQQDLQQQGSGWPWARPRRVSF